MRGCVGMCVCVRDERVCWDVCVCEGWQEGEHVRGERVHGSWVKEIIVYLPL